MTNFRTLTLILAILLGGCAGTSYAPGKAASDIPAGVDTIRLYEVVPIHMFTVIDNAEEAIDPSPSENDREVLAVARQALIKEFAAAGIKVIEDDSRPTAVSMRLFVAYIPERWPLIDRQMAALLRVFDGDGQFLFREAKGRGSATVFQSMVQTRDEFVGGSIQGLVQSAVEVLRGGTKHVAVTRPAAPPPALPVAVTQPTTPVPPATAATAALATTPAAAASATATPPMVAAAAAATAPVLAPHEGFDGHWLATGEFPSGGARDSMPCAGYKLELVVTGNKLEASLPTNRITTHVVATISANGSFASSVGAYGVSLSGKFSGDTVDVELHSGVCPRTPGKGHRIS